LIERGFFIFSRPLSIRLFAFVSALTLAMSLGAIAYHTLKAARTNPVEAPRHE
jgi:ABC-type lipoprotein release transport system permease subunit